jgi:hypothetical protein
MLTHLDVKYFHLVDSSLGGMAMTTLYDSSEMFTGTDVRTVLSFWQRLIISIGSHRQRQANQYLAEYLRRHPEYQENFS